MPDTFTKDPTIVQLNGHQYLTSLGEIGYHDFYIKEGVGHVCCHHAMDLKTQEDLRLTARKVVATDDPYPKLPTIEEYMSDEKAIEYLKQVQTPKTMKKEHGITIIAAHLGSQTQYYSKDEVLEVIETTLRAHMPRYMNEWEVEETVLKLFNDMEANTPTT